MRGDRADLAKDESEGMITLPDGLFDFEPNEQLMSVLMAGANNVLDAMLGFVCIAIGAGIAMVLIH